MSALVLMPISLGGCAGGPTHSTVVPSVSASAPVPRASGLAETEVYRQMIDASWASIVSMDAGAERPRTAIVRYVTPQEQLPLIAECVREEGFSATLQPGGAITFGEVPQSQGTALNVAVYVCEASYPLEDRYTVPPSEDQIRRLYAYLTVDATACLTDLGYTIASPPSWQQYYDTYYSERAWSPFASVNAATADEWYQAIDACPQFPDDWWG